MFKNFFFMRLRKNTTKSDILCHVVGVCLYKIKEFYMNLLSFMKEFPTEQSCKEHFITYRKGKGVVCQKCASTEHYWLNRKEQFQCKQCRFRTTLRSGTVLHATKLPYMYWYIAMHLMTSTKKGFSAHELKRQLGHKRYEPIWAMMHKIRESMGLADAKFILKDSVGIDDAYISTYTSMQDRVELKRGKGSQKKSKVTVMVESIPLEKNGKEEMYMGKAKLVLNPSEESENIDSIALQNIASDSILFSDKSSSYVNLKNYFEENIQTISEELKSKIDLKWINVTISNLKRFLLGIYHVVKERYLQEYLNEFAFKLNRRNYTNKFDNLLLNSI